MDWHMKDHIMHFSQLIFCNFRVQRNSQSGWTELIAFALVYLLHFLLQRKNTPLEYHRNFYSTTLFYAAFANVWLLLLLMHAHIPNTQNHTRNTCNNGLVECIVSETRASAENILLPRFSATWICMFMFGNLHASTKRLHVIQTAYTRTGTAHLSDPRSRMPWRMSHTHTQTIITCFAEGL